ncbi:MAG: alpha-hydroxy-acid oxidizing protein [Desulfobacteraceae bacterium]|nr:alpha-hydroxy-acid oxidizing protein [Desulfobacteraceae bacterium]
MWTGTPIPQNLRQIAETGVPLAANVKPFEDRKKMFQALDEVQETGVRWVGVEIDAGQGTKVKDRQMAFDCTPLSFGELKEIRKAVSLPLILKGVLSQADAVKAIEVGADGIVVSNHGAHTLDYLPHPLQVMDEILEKVKGETVVMVDGGFRRGSDVLKGLAFGASLIGLGRPILYGLAANGREGVKGVIEGITVELKRIMSMVGVANPDRVSKDVLIKD